MGAIRPVLSQPKHFNFISVWGIVMTAILLALVPAGRGARAAIADRDATHYHLEIPREPLNSALKDLAIQTGLQIARLADASVNGAIAGPLSGNYTLAESLSRLLANTGLTFRQINANTIAIVAGARPSSAAEAAVPAPAATNEGAPVSPAESPNRVPPAEERPPQPRRSFFSRLAAIFGICTAAALNNPACAQEAAAAATKPQPQLEEVVVTGTSIRGVAPTGSELVTMSLDDINATTATTSTELLRSVPQMKTSPPPVPTSVTTRPTSSISRPFTASVSATEAPV